MKSSILTIIFFLLAAGWCGGQTVTLEECQRLAQENYPLISQRGLIDKLADYNVSNARRNWLPQVAVSANAMYLSEVPMLPANLASLLPQLNIYAGDFPNDIYSASVGVQQVVWDGGMIRAQVSAAKADAEVSRRNWDAEMYALRGRVNQLYFGSLMLQESVAVADLLIADLKRNYIMLESMAKYGTADRNDIDKINAEILTATQQRIQLETTRLGYIQMLGIMTGGGVSAACVLVKPSCESTVVCDMVKRPELGIFDAQESLLSAQRKAVRAGVMPQIGAFIQGAYSNIGPDIFGSLMNDKWSKYFIAGVKLQWNIGNFYTMKNRMSQIDLNASRIASQREAFLYNISLESAQEKAAVCKMREVITYDDGIIEMRTNIRRRTEAQVEGGDASVNDLLRDINAEDRARLNKAAHEVELLKNIYDLKYTVNE